MLTFVFRETIRRSISALAGGASSAIVSMAATLGWRFGEANDRHVTMQVDPATGSHGLHG